jgi:hypothetical protein
MAAPKVDPHWETKYPDHPEVWRMYEDFKVFLHIVWAHLGLPVPTPVQLDMADYLQYGPRRRIIEGFRGVGKSYVTVAFVIWLLLRDPDHSIMVVSAGEDRATAFSTFTKRIINEMDILQHLATRHGQRTSNEAFDVGPAAAKGSPSVKSVGIFGQLTGSRADTIVADDIEVPKNSETQNMRDKLAELIKEFDAVLKPGGNVIYLGTPQTEQSLYNKLPERGYDIRIWPVLIPTEAYFKRMGRRLAPYVHKLMKAGHEIGKSLDPKRFDEDEVAERKLSYGASGFALQFLLDTSLSDADRYPLRLRDLIVMPLDSTKGPASVAWGPKRANLYHDIHTPGMDGDGFYSPAYVDESAYQPYTGAAMFVDPAGRGKDETTWAVGKVLNATIFITKMVGTQGGYEDHILKRIAQDAKDQAVNVILVETNFGDGMFEKLLQPHLTAIEYPCLIESVRSNRQKELRIIDTLEPIMNQHRLVIDEEVVRDDDLMVQSYTEEQATQYRLFHQMTRITKVKGALRHDDRLDALAGIVAYWVDTLAQGAQKAAQKAKDKIMDKAMKQFIQDQVDPRHRGPHRTQRKKSRDGFSLRL